jgi:hypothetical protein
MVALLQQSCIALTCIIITCLTTTLIALRCVTLTCIGLLFIVLKCLANLFYTPSIILYYHYTCTAVSADMILKRHLSHLPTQEYKYFRDNALYVMPTWARAIPITIEYLKKNQKPVARCDI